MRLSCSNASRGAFFSFAPNHYMAIHNLSSGNCSPMPYHSPPPLSNNLSNLSHFSISNARSGNPTVKVSQCTRSYPSTIFQSHPLVPLVTRRFQVLHPLLRRHCIPLRIPLFVAPNIVCLGEKIQPYITNSNPQQRLVAPLVIWRIILAVDIGRDDAPSLHKHIVTGRRDGAGPHRVRVARVPTDLDRMCYDSRQAL